MIEAVNGGIQLRVLFETGRLPQAETLEGARVLRLPVLRAVRAEVRDLVEEMMAKTDWCMNSKIEFVQPYYAAAYEKLVAEKEITMSIVAGKITKLERDIKLYRSVLAKALMELAKHDVSTADLLAGPMFSTWDRIEYIANREDGSNAT